MDIAEQRIRYVTIARTWIKTPFHDNASIKGAGCDCLGFIYGAAREAGIVGDIKIPNYSPQQNLHRAEETYLNGLLQYCDEVPGPPVRTPVPGDLVIWRFGRLYFHTAIVTDWPLILHCHKSLRGVGPEDASKCSWLNFISERVSDEGKPRPRKFLVLKAWNT